MRSITAQARDDSGAVTIELAIGIATFLAVLGMAITALATLGAYISAIDIAGAAARAHAVAAPFDPPRGEVIVREQADMVQVTARVPAPLGVMEATALYPVQYATAAYE